MNCQKASKWIQLQADGELPVRARPALATHLQGCGNCRKLQEQTALLCGAFEELSASTAAPTARRLQFTRLRLRWEYPLAFAAAIALAMGTWALSHQAVPQGGQGKLFVADQRDGHGTHHQAVGRQDAGVNKLISLGQWTDADRLLRMGLVLLTIGLIFLLYRIVHLHRAVQRE